MPLVNNSMSEFNFKKRRDEAVEKLVSTLRLRERGEYRNHINSIVKIVEDLLNE